MNCISQVAKLYHSVRNYGVGLLSRPQTLLPRTFGIREDYFFNQIHVSITCKPNPLRNTIEIGNLTGIEY